MKKQDIKIAEYSLFILFKFLLFPSLFFMPLFLEDKGITGWRTGLLMGETYFVGFLMALPLGVMNDRYEPKRMVALSLILMVFSMFFITGWDSFYVLLAAFLMFGLARNIFQISFDTLFFKQVIKGRGCVHIGRYQLAFAYSTMAGLFTAALVLDRISFPVLYAGTGVMFLLLLYPARHLSLAGTSVIAVSIYKKTVLKAEFLPLAMLIFLFALHWGTEDTCYGLFLRHYLHADKGVAALYMMSEFFVLGTTAYVMSRLIDRFSLNLRWVFAVGIAVSGTALILQVNEVFFVSMLMRMLHGAGDALVMVVIYYGVSRVFELDKMGGNMGAVMLLLILGSFSGAIVFSLVGNRFGYHVSFLVTGIILVFVAFWFIIYNIWKDFIMKSSFLKSEKKDMLRQQKAGGEEKPPTF